jgi:hypothetical protein
VQEPVAWVDLLKQAEEIVRSKSLWKKYIDGTPLANDIAVWMVSFAQEHTTPPGQPAPVQEPVAWISHNAGLYHFKPDESLDPMPLYTTPPAAQRQWVGLTDEEIEKLTVELRDIPVTLAFAIEAKLKERNV